MVSTPAVVVGPAVTAPDDGDSRRAARDQRAAERRWYDRRGVGAWMVLGLTVLAAAAFTAGIQTPWPWSDEGATYLALLRDWGQLPALYGGPDAPMVPYYFVVKAWATALQAVWPSMSTLVATRLLSAAAATATVGVLYALVARNAGRFAGALAGIALVSLAGFDRYAQEARPYAMLALAAAISWLLWDRWLRPHVAPTFTRAVENRTAAERPWRRIGRGAGYALSLAAVATVHTFGLFQWPAHALATVVATSADRARRVRRIISLAALMATAAALAAAQVVPSVLHGTGPPGSAGARIVTLWTILTQLARAMSAAPQPLVSAVALALAALGASRCIKGDHARFARNLLVWLCTPLVLELALAVVKTNLFRLRYWIAFLPPLAALMALGAVTLASAVVGTVRRPDGGPGASRRSRAVALATLVATVAIAAQVAVGMSSQLVVRAANGHGQDLARVLTLVAQTRDQQPGIPVLIDNRSATGMLGAAEPALEARNVLRHLDPSASYVYTTLTHTKTVRAQLAGTTSLLWIYRGELAAAQARSRMPHNLSALHPNVVWMKPAGPGWTVLMLDTR